MTNTKTPKVTRTQEITAILRERILSGEIPAGARLRQDAIAGEFGVSAIPVREALNRLAAIGLLVVSPHRGAEVRGLSLQEIGDLFSLRATIEAAVLRDAIPRMTALDFVVLERAIEAFTRRTGDASIGELNWRFHSALYSPSGRVASLGIIEMLHARTDRYQRLQLALKGNVSKSESEHRRLVALCREGRRDEAAELLLSHIIGAGAEVVELLAKQSARAESAADARLKKRRAPSRSSGKRSRTRAARG